METKEETENEEYEWIGFSPMTIALILVILLIILSCSAFFYLKVNGAI